MVNYFERMPDLAFINLMKYLDFEDRKATRLISPRVGQRVREFDDTFDTCKVYVKQDTYHKTQDDLRKYVQSVDFTDTSVDLHMDIGKYHARFYGEVLDDSILKMVQQRIKGLHGVTDYNLSYLTNSKINFWKLDTLSMEAVVESSMETLDTFLGQCKLPFKKLSLNSCVLSLEVIEKHAKLFSGLDTLILESDGMSEAALSRIITLSQKTLTTINMFDIRVYLSLKNIADNLDFLNLEQLVIFNQLSSLSGLLHFLNKCSHSLKYLTLETFHLKDLDSDLMQPLAFPKLRKLKITSMGNTRFHGIKDLGNLQSLILESTEAIKGITLVELLEQCGSSLRELEISSLASRVPLTPQAELPNLKRLKFCKVDIFPSGQHYDEVLKLIQKCSPTLEKLTLQGKNISDLDHFDKFISKLPSLKFLDIMTRQGASASKDDCINIYKLLNSSSSTLMHLYLEGCNLVDVDLKHLSELKSLRLRRNNIDNKNIIPLLAKSSRNLEILEINCKEIDLSNVDEIEDGFPKLRKLILRSQNVEKMVPGLVDLLDLCSSTLQAFNLFHVSLVGIEDLRSNLSALTHISIFPKVSADKKKALLSKCPPGTVVK